MRDLSPHPELDTPAEEAHAHDRPLGMLVCAWIAAALFAVYAGPDLREAVSGSETLQAIPLLSRATDRLAALAAQTGAVAARERWAALAANAEAPEVVLQREPPPPPAPVAREPGGPLSPSEAQRRTVEEGPKRVLLVGASSVQYYLGAELERRLEAHRDVTVLRLGKLGTGLARPDVFDWPAKLAELLDAFQPDLVIAMLGGNDAQALSAKDAPLIRFGTAAWDREYARRVKRVISMSHARRARVVMLGMPAVRNEGFTRRLVRVNKVTQEASESAGAQYLSTADLAADPQGGYLPTITYEGETGLSRLRDGVHYSRLGALYVSERIDWRLQRLFAWAPVNPGLASASRHDFHSQMLGGVTSYLAFVPQGLAPDERVPLLLLLHGADGSWADWSEHAHAELQRLAAEHRIAIVTPDGGTGGWYLESARVPGGRQETFFLEELLPEVERALPVSGVRAIAGLSMGGHGALSLALKYPETFVSASSMSGAVDLTEATNRTALIARLGPYEQNPAVWHRHSVMDLVRGAPERARAMPVMITVGQGDRWLGANRNLDALLSEIGAPHLYEEAIGNHDWDYWTSVLPRHVGWHATQLEARAARTPL